MNAGGLGPVGQADAQREARLLALLGGGSFVPNCYLDFSLDTNALNVRLLTAAGHSPNASNPIIAAFHDVAASVGKPVVRRVAQRVSLTIPSGAEMGFANSTAGKLWFVLFDDTASGQQRLGAINCLSSLSVYPLGAWPIASSTAIGTGADSAHVFYTDAALTSMPYVVLGWASWESGLSTKGTWDALPTRRMMHGPNGKLPGETVQSVGNATGAVATTTTTIPEDDTIPQIGEGGEFMTQAIVPSSAANVLRIRGAVNGSLSAGTNLVAAVFQDATAGALVAAAFVNPVNGDYQTIHVEHQMLAATTVSTTFRVRAGPNTAGTFTFNGTGAGRIFGGVFNSYLSITEIVA